MNVDRKHTADVASIRTTTWRQGGFQLPESRKIFKRNDLIKTHEDFSNKKLNVPAGTMGVVIAVNEKRLVARLQRLGDLGITTEEASKLFECVPVYMTLENKFKYYINLTEEFVPGSWVTVTSIDPRQNIWKFRPVYPGMQVIGQRGQILFPIFSIPGMLTMYRVLLNSGEWEFTDKELSLAENPSL